MTQHFALTDSQKAQIIKLWGLEPRLSYQQIARRVNRGLTLVCEFLAERGDAEALAALPPSRVRAPRLNPPPRAVGQERVSLKCLCCQRPFLSVDRRRNRMCDSCRRLA
jgi:hypothetical protein